MEILTPGNKAKIWSDVVACTQCDATLGVNESDLLVKESEYLDTYTGLVVLNVWVRCPECGCHVSLGNLVPREVASRHLIK